MDSAPLLRVQNLSVSYDVPQLNWLRSSTANEDLDVVKNVSFDVGHGEILGIVGASGCGKSTTARCVAGLIPKRTGRIELAGEVLKGRSPDIQMIFQDPATSLNPRLTIFDNVSEPLRYVGKKKSHAEMLQLCKETLQKVGMNEDHLSRYPHQFSGGQLQRIGIARALVRRPKLIICDEPVSALDISIQAQVLNLLKGLQREYNLSLLFITHDLAVVRYLSDRCLVMHDGQIVEQGLTDDLIQSPQHVETQRLIAAIPGKTLRT